MHEPQLLRSQLTSEPTDPRYVSAGPVKTGHETNLDGVGAACEDDWDGCRCCLSCECRIVTSDRRDDGHLTSNQVGGQLGQALFPTLCPTVLDRQVPALDIAHFIQTIAERGGVAG